MLGERERGMDGGEGDTVRGREGEIKRESEVERERGRLGE